jgi:hypothetical protein
LAEAGAGLKLAIGVDDADPAPSGEAGAEAGGPGAAA